MQWRGCTPPPCPPARQRFALAALGAESIAILVFEGGGALIVPNEEWFPKQAISGEVSRPGPLQVAFAQRRTLRLRGLALADKLFYEDPRRLDGILQPERVGGAYRIRLPPELKHGRLSLRAGPGQLPQPLVLTLGKAPRMIEWGALEAQEHRFE